jgi:DNA-binding NarL/FixJ family response regulator
MENKSKIVIIDDHEIMIDCITKILESNKTNKIIGFAKTGKEGLKMVLEKMPDIVLLDIGLPDMDGGMVAEKIYEKRSNYPF